MGIRSAFGPLRLIMQRISSKTGNPNFPIPVPMDRFSGMVPKTTLPVPMKKQGEGELPRSFRPCTPGMKFILENGPVTSVIQMWDYAEDSREM